jgi:hypothetical protein
MYSLTIVDYGGGDEKMEIDITTQHDDELMQIKKEKVVEDINEPNFD